MRGAAYTLGGTPHPLYPQKATANNYFFAVSRETFTD